jgi:hypothetical protein
MTNDNGSSKEFSGRFQIRISPDIHMDLLKFANGMNEPMNDIVALAIIYSIRNNSKDFLKFADEYLNGYHMVKENHMPIATLARRNLISYQNIDEDHIEIEMKVKEGSVWRKRKIIADLRQNVNLLDCLKKWLTPKNVD